MAAKKVTATASAAPSYTLPAGVQPGTAPQMGPIGNLSGPGLANVLMQYQNQANKANNDRYNQGLSVLGNMQNQTTDLYNKAGQAVTDVGNQALNRINLQEQNNLGSLQQSSINRGLGNTTIADTMKALPTMEANDARTGVNEMQGKLKSGILEGMAGQTQSEGNQIADFVASRTDAGPNAAMFASLAQGAAAGNNGAPPPMQKSTIMGNIPVGIPTAQGGPAAPQAPGGYFSGGSMSNALAGGSASMGGAGGAGAGGYFSGGGGAPSNMGGGGGDYGGGYNGSMMMPGSNWFMPNGGGAGNIAGASGQPMMNNAGNNMVTPLPDGLPPGSVAGSGLTPAAQQESANQLAGVSWADLLGYGNG